jgi:aldehyde:ferredoxin oxidoreductase
MCRVLSISSSETRVKGCEVTDMVKSYGWAGKVLHVDLTNEIVNKAPTTDYRPEEFIGGVGLNAKIFWELGCPKVGAFDPGNPLIISVGPLTGIYGPFSRGEICSISPQCYPDELFTYSGFGGMFPAEMKYAGYDAIIIIGKAKRPVYLSIYDEDVKIKDASELWGLDTFEAQQALLTDEPEASVLVIGPAGENLSRIAIILNETECAAGQGGFGAVMGSKNLKAIAVRGTGVVEVSKPHDVMQLTRTIMEENDKISIIGQLFRTPYMAQQETKDIFASRYFKKPYGCYGCPQQCRGIHDIPGIGLSGASCENWMWAPKFGNEPKEIWEANVLSQKLGINTYEVIDGISLLLATSFEARILRRKEIEEVIGLPTPKWLGGKATNHEFLTVLLHKIAHGEIPYAEGTARFAEHFAQKLASGEEFMGLYYELSTARGYAFHHVDNLGSALHWATDTRDPVNSCHEYKNFPYPEKHLQAMEHFGLPSYDDYQIVDLSKTVYQGAERVTVWVQDNQCLKNSLPLCEFFGLVTSFHNPPEMDLRIFESRLLSAVTGLDMDVDTMAKAGERIWNLYRAIMVKRENRTRDNDILNEPYFRKAITCHMGSATGLVNGPIDRDKFKSLKDRYYELRGWDVNTGWPTRAKLEELGLRDVADEMASIGRLS